MERTDLERYKQIGGNIDLKTAIEWTSNYRSANPEKQFLSYLEEKLLIKYLVKINALEYECTMPTAIN